MAEEGSLIAEKREKSGGSSESSLNYVSQTGTRYGKSWNPEGGRKEKLATKRK